MTVSLGTFIIAVVVAQIVSFVVSALLYMNPPVTKAYKKYQDHQAVKKAESRGQWMLKMFFLSLIEVFFAGLIFFLTADLLPGMGWAKGFYFGLLLAGVRVVGRSVYMHMLTSYPIALLRIEFIHGIIDCVVIGLCFSYFL